MIINNLKALFWYVFLRFLTFFSNFFIGFNSSKPKSEQEVMGRMDFQQTKTWITFFVVIMLYCVFARVTLREQGSRVKNILSVSLIFVVGLILCIVLSLGYHNFEPLYFMYTSAFSSIFPTYIKEGGLLMQLPYTIIPCLLMGISIRQH
jgi:ACR3 family arsenite efflux pump ArsB